MEESWRERREDVRSRKLTVNGRKRVRGKREWNIRIGEK